MTTEKRKRPPGDTPGPKYALVERYMTPEQEKAKFVEQDDRFCAAMLKAIAAGMERP